MHVRAQSNENSQHFLVYLIDETLHQSLQKTTVHCFTMYNTLLLLSSHLLVVGAYVGVAI